MVSSVPVACQTSINAFRKNEPLSRAYRRSTGLSNRKWIVAGEAPRQIRPFLNRAANTSGVLQEIQLPGGGGGIALTDVCVSGALLTGQKSECVINGEFFQKVERCTEALTRINVRGAGLSTGDNTHPIGPNRFIESGPAIAPCWAVR